MMTIKKARKIERIYLDLGNFTYNVALQNPNSDIVKAETKLGMIG